MTMLANTVIFKIIVVFIDGQLQYYIVLTFIIGCYTISSVYYRCM